MESLGEAVFAPPGQGRSAAGRWRPTGCPSDWCGRHATPHVFSVL